MQSVLGVVIDTTSAESVQIRVQEKKAADTLLLLAMLRHCVQSRARQTGTTHKIHRLRLTRVLGKLLEKIAGRCAWFSASSTLLPSATRALHAWSSSLQYHQETPSIEERGLRSIAWLQEWLQRPTVLPLRTPLFFHCPAVLVSDAGETGAGGTISWPRWSLPTVAFYVQFEPGRDIYKASSTVREAIGLLAGILVIRRIVQRLQLRPPSGLLAVTDSQALSLAVAKGSSKAGMLNKVVFDMFTVLRDIDLFAMVCAWQSRQVNVVADCIASGNSIATEAGPVSMPTARWPRNVRAPRDLIAVAPILPPPFSSAFSSSAASSSGK